MFERSAGAGSAVMLIPLMDRAAGLPAASGGDRGPGPPFRRPVRSYLSSAVTKLGVASRYEAVRQARIRGWI